ADDHQAGTKETEVWRALHHDQRKQGQRPYQVLEVWQGTVGP
ncbi:hypothetical protein LCGC14_1835850, partial [marine sediment metagenome]